MHRDDSTTGVDEFIELLNAAVIYAIPGLQFECELELSRQIRNTNVGKIMVAAVELKCEILCEDVQTFLCENRRKHMNLPTCDSKYRDHCTHRSEPTIKSGIKTHHSPVINKDNIYTQPIVRKASTASPESSGGIKIDINSTTSKQEDEPFPCCIDASDNSLVNTIPY